MSNAAVALLNGVDPQRYLDADMSHVRIMNRVIEHAQELGSKRKDNELKALGAVIAQNLAKLLR